MTEMSDALSSDESRVLALQIFGHLDDGAPLPPVEESELSVWFVKYRLKGKVLHNTKQGWWYYDGVVWKPLDPTVVTEGLRIAISDLHTAAKKRGVGSDERKILKALSSKVRIKACVELAKGQVYVDPGEFDTHPELLNVMNGYVDLRDGTLHPHDPALRFSKVAGAKYIPCAHHPDVDEALEALLPEERAWLKVRLGAALFGTQLSDEVLFLLGGGSNGKSTIVVATKVAGGDYVVMLPEKTMMAGKYDHSTELMPLKGARVAILEELPEGQDLPVKRLKLLAGTSTVTARAIRQDNETFSATHTLFVTTNKLPAVRETDEGTWRRLLVLNFPFHFVKSAELVGPNERVGDLNLRRRIQENESGQAEAFLTWMIEGAVEYSQNGGMPASTPLIQDAVEAWRTGEDKLLEFFLNEIEVDTGRHIATHDLHRAYEHYMTDSGDFPLKLDAFLKACQTHGRLAKFRQGTARPRFGTEGRSLHRGVGTFATSAQYTAWKNIRFRNEENQEQAPANLK
jgi:putative DNA primase/helicase